jgi:hypothetical protein
VLLEREADRLRAARTEAVVQRQPDGTSIVLVPRLVLPPGWNLPQVGVRWVLSAAYPAGQPDCFYADQDLRLSSGAMPANSGFQDLAGEPLLWFSWHLQAGWRPGKDDLLTYLRFVESRLADAR